MKNKIFFIVFMLVWITLIVLNFIVKSDAFSEQENRYLAKLPTFTLEKLFNGTYQEELDTYINDHFIFRNAWIKIKSESEILLGKDENNGVYIGKDGYLFEKFEYKENEKEHLEKVANTINQFISNTELPTYFMLIPNSIYINQDKLPDNVTTYNQNDIINNFYSKLDGKIKTINVTDILMENKDKYIYFKTDHHMTSLGTYLTYTKLCEAANLEAEDLSNFEVKMVSDSFLGTFDSKAQVPNQEKDKIEVYINEKNSNIKSAEYDNETTQSIFNSEYLEKKDKYSFFLNGNNAKVVIKTNVENGKKLLVIKDSYAHIMAQFLCQNFEEIHFIDPRYYKASLTEYATQNNITEILFLYNTSNLVSDLGILSIH